MVLFRQDRTGRPNDLIALGAIGALHAQGRRVPEDISIIGFDNISYASTFEPALTTIAQPIATLGQECLSLFVERIHQPEKECAKIVLLVELIERSSCRSLDELAPFIALLLQCAKRHVRDHARSGCA